MLTERPDIEAVSIYVPNKYHAETIIYCLNADKNISCEKPPAINTAQVEEMNEAAEKS